MAERIIIAGGGTGGHIFPAISIANELKKRDAANEVLFVGAKGGLEMTLVAKHEYDIKGVWISGIARKVSIKNIFRNLFFPFKLMVGILQSRRIISKFKPTVVVGVGGYASGPIGRAAAGKKIPLVLCEQNAYPGMTNKWLATKATVILLGNEDAVQYFDPAKTKVTGNPVRADLIEGSRAGGIKRYDLRENKPVLLILGGSLGAKTMNDALEKSIPVLIKNDIQVVWQCGKRYYETLKHRVQMHPLIKLIPFIDNMADAYAMADLIVSRAGGSTISEIVMLSKPAILVPSPNVAEDHQTKNALSLSERGAAILVSDAEAPDQLVPAAMKLLSDPDEMEKLTKKIKSVRKHDAAKEIVDEIIKAAHIEEKIQ